MISVYPHVRFHRITDISLAYLQDHAIKALILDIDNTLTTHDNPEPLEGGMAWLRMVQEAGIPCIVLSNNHEPRVRPFAAMLGLDFEPEGKKPLTGGYHRAAKKMGVPMSSCAVIGDQLFTDIWGGRRAGCYCILVDFIEAEKTWFFRAKRRAERLLLGMRGR